ncbi:leucine-rich repeat flightless-interacting protein 1 isoform X5 [Triplophysa rosa]|uniref:leucine-rich repeat flightless-interacting protein 1 isoform X5 n=1 Tax=Triplophysa rosa TaxID=992332 RepID=UPI002546193D|nr:leucine-rich repeat flightless-interacting protein 1 isoform X5 [Triplophysa rosa]
MGSQGPGRKRTTSKNGLTAEEDALNVIAREAEARLAAKRAARAEAREIRMKELERQQKEIYQVQKKYYGLDNLDNKWGDIEQWMEDSERYTRLSRRHASVSDDEERMSVGSRSDMRLPQIPSSHSHKKSKKKKKHSSKTSNGCDDDDLSTLSSRSSRLSDESKRSRSSRPDLQSGPVYEDSLYSGSRRSSVRASSEYSGFRGSRTSSRANSACSSPVEDCSSSVASYMHSSTASITGLTRDLDHVIIPDLPDVNGRPSMADDRLERDYLEKGSSRASTISGATLTSLGGTSSRRGSGDTSFTADTEVSIREIKEIHELKDQIQDVEAKHMQNLKELKESLMEVEGKYRKAMVSNAQMDNEKTNLIYEVDILKDSLMELEEMLSETRRELEEKSKDFEREKHAHSILQFQYNELKETLKQSEELLTALERQKEFSDAIRNERDELRDEVVQLKDILKKHGIVLGHDLATNGETGEEVGETEQSSQTSSVEIREGSSVLGTHQLKMCKDQDRKILDKDVKQNQVSSHVPLSSTEKSLDTNENGDFREEVNLSEEQQSDNRPEPKPPSSVGDREIVVTKPTAEIKAEQLVLEDLGGNTVEFDVHIDGPMETDQQESICAKQIIKKETSVESDSGPILEEDQPGEDVLDNKSKPMEKPVESLHTEKLPQSQGAGVSNKKKKKKKKSKQKQKQSDKLESEAKIDSKNEKVFSEDNPDQNLKSDQKVNHEDYLRNDVFTAMHTEIPADDSHDDKRKVEMDCVKKIIADKHADDARDQDKHADDARDQFKVIQDLVDSAEISNSESTTGKSFPSTVSISNITDQTEVSANPPQEVSSEKDALLSHEVSDKLVDTADRCVETLDSVSRFDNIEKSLMVDDTEVKRHVDSEAFPPLLMHQSIDPEESAFSGDHDESVPKCPLASSITEKVENESENVIQEQSTSHNSIEVDQNEVKTQQDELVEEALHSGEAFNRDGNIDTAVSESQLVLEKGEGEEEERSLHDQLLPDQDSLGASDQECKLEKGDYKKEGSFQGPITIDMQLPGEAEDILADKSEKVEKEESTQVMLDVQIPDDKGILVEKGEDHETEGSIQDQVMLDTQLPGNNDDILMEKGEEHEEEDSVQDQVMLDTQLSGEDEGVLVESVTGSPELREDPEEEDEGENFEFDDMDLEASSNDPPKHCKDQASDDVTLLKESVHEANKEYQSNAINEDHTQDDEPLERPDQDSEQKKQMDDENTIENPQTTTEVETCLTEDSQVNKKDIKPDHQQQECTLEKHHRTSEELRHSDPISEMETKDVGQEMNSSIIHENQGTKTSREQEAERETTTTNKEDDRKETKKSSKKGKGKGKEECKMS